MDMSKFAESKYLTIDFVKQQKGQQIVATIIQPPQEELNKFGNASAKLDIQIKIGDRFVNKIYKPNMDAIKALIRDFGEEGDKWNGQIILFNIRSLNNKETIEVRKFNNVVV